MAISDLFKTDVRVLNFGMEAFKLSLDQCGINAVQVAWKPPLDVSLDAAERIRRARKQIEKANERAIRAILAAQPTLIGLERARDVIPGMRRNLILHAGPPITWDRMCGPMRGAIIGALLYEGLAKNPREAAKLAESGEIRYAPCHEHGAVGPMAGIISASMPVFIVENEAAGNRAYCTLNEGLGKVLRYGAYSAEVIARLKWMENTLFPTLQKAIRKRGRIDLKNLIAQALHMGDEVHNRNRAGTSLFYRAIAPAIATTCNDPKIVADTLEFINRNDHFFLNLSMPACKASLDAARGIRHSSLVVVMARNGVEFGIQLAGTDKRWFTGPAAVPEALFFAGFSRKDANPDIGDSAITETNGLGGFAIAAAPAIVQFVGGKASDAIRYTTQMYEITTAENNTYQIPYLNFRGTPTGIDVMKVIEKHMLPFIDTGVAHRKAGVGQIGAGVVSAPPEPFQKAFEGLAKTL